MINLYRWNEKDYNMAETAYCKFSILFGNQHGLQVGKGNGFLMISLGTGRHCYELSFVNMKKRPDWLDYEDENDDRSIFKIGVKK